MDPLGKTFTQKQILVLLLLLTRIEIILALQFTVEPSSVLVFPNGRAVFKCSADNDEAEIRWMRDNQFIRHDPDLGIQITDNRLIVKPITNHATVINALSSATFQCVITYQGFSLLSQQARLIVAELKPFAPQEDINVEVIEGNIAVIPCQPPHSVPVAVTEFVFNDLTISKSQGRYVLLPSGNLHIADVAKADEGVYRCVVNNPFLGYKIKALHRINLRVLRPSRRQQIAFTHRPVKNIGVVTGSNVTMECAAVGYPVPRITWIKRRGEIPSKRSRKIAGNLMLFDVQTEDAGSYSCLATNKDKQGVSAVVTLTINELPEASNPTGVIAVRKNSDVILKCSVTGSPKPSITWIHNGLLLNRRSSISIRYDSLVLKDVKSSQAGAYQCFASNELGSSYSSSFLTVKSDDSSDSLVEPKRPSDRGRRRKGDKKRRRKKKGKGKGKKKNKNKKKDNSESEEIVDASGSMVPPSRPHITKLTDYSVMVRWDVPENDGLKITFFKLQYRDVGELTINGASEWRTLTAEIEPHIRSYEVLDLETGHVYRFRIAAAYSNNDSKFGPTSYKFKLEKEPPMKKPVIGPSIISAEAISPSAILMSWEYKQSLDEVDIDGFFVYYRSAHTAGVYTKMTVLGFNTRSHIIDHLLSNIAYEMKMQSFNMAGVSSFSNIFTAKTKGHENATAAVDVGHRNVVRISSDTHKSSQLLYTVLGVALGIMLVGLFIFIIACSIKQRNERLPNELDHAIHSKYQDTSAHIHESHHLNGGLLTRSSPLVKNHNIGIQNGYIANDSAAKININVNPLSYDTTEEDGSKTPQLEMIPMNNNEEMIFSRLLQNSNNQDRGGSPCNEPTEFQPMLASEENSQIQSPVHSSYDGRIPISSNSSSHRFSKSSLSNLDSDDEG